jgi:activator of 2-hydroxyglutaryl-CoA dehydratase
MTIKDSLLGIDVGSVAAGIVLISKDRQLLHEGYGFHHGDIRKTLEKLPQDLDLIRTEQIVATASTPPSIKAEQRYHNEICFTTAAKNSYAQMGALLPVGGEKFSLTTFNAHGQYLGSTTNTSCAAGTGSFLDLQAGSSKGAGPQIASRCAVFAKTDLIHAQQEGYQLDLYQCKTLDNQTVHRRARS